MPIGDAIVDIARNAAAKQEDGDYMQDGLLYCGKCNTPKQCRIKLGDKEAVVGCMCKCKQDEYAAEEKRHQSEQSRQRIDRLRERGISDRGLLHCRFENAVQTAEIGRCKAYVEKWEEVKQRNIGVMFWGEAGTGKTFAAACIANALIDKGVSAIVTSFPRILAQGFDRTELLEQIRSCDLVVIDDLGAERTSEYALETVYMVLDERYKTKKPLIVTTNMTVDYMKSKKSDIAYWRAYQRVLEMCVPIEFKDGSFRAKIARGKYKAVGGLIGGTTE